MTRLVAVLGLAITTLTLWLLTISGRLAAPAFWLLAVSGLFGRIALLPFGWFAATTLPLTLGSTGLVALIVSLWLSVVISFCGLIIGPLLTRFAAMRIGVAVLTTDRLGLGPPHLVLMAIGHALGHGVLRYLLTEEFLYILKGGYVQFAH